MIFVQVKRVKVTESSGTVQIIGYSYLNLNEILAIHYVDFKNGGSYFQVHLKDCCVEHISEPSGRALLSLLDVRKFDFV